MRESEIVDLPEPEPPAMPTIRGGREGAASTGRHDTHRAGSAVLRTTDGVIRRRNPRVPTALRPAADEGLSRSAAPAAGASRPGRSRSAPWTPAPTRPSGHA